MVPEINWWAVLVATASSMIVGSIWYAKAVFGTRWMKLAHVSDEIMSKNPGVAIGVTIVVSFVTAAVLAGSAAIAHSFYGGNFVVNAIVTSIFLWGGFTAARLITHDAFERRPLALTVMNVVHELVTVVVMALVIGLFGISV